MALHAPFPQEAAPQPDDPLTVVVLRYQQLHHSWSTETHAARRAPLRIALRETHEELWLLLAEPLARVAHSWLRSGMARDMWATPSSYPSREDVLRSLAMNMYLHVIDALPQLQIDPSKNLLACLKLIATRGMFDEQRRIYQSGPRQPSSQAAEVLPTPGSSAGQMWPSNRSTTAHVRKGQDPSDLADPQSVDFEEQLAVLLDQQACCQAIWAFWEMIADVDQRIVMLRWNRQPPLPYEAIAQQLGPEWNAATVRQRHSRIISRTRAHLQQLGLIDGEDADSTVRR